MNQQDIWQWCQHNNWTEPRQLSDGNWVAFPPGGVIETPLPIEEKVIVETSTNRLQNLLDGLVLIVATIIVGAIALVISPLFIAHKIRRGK